jgi:hypothetical protein
MLVMKKAATVQGSLRLVTADTSELLRAICRFRYRIYVKELKFDHPDANHALLELTDQLDQHSTNFALVEKDGTIAASLRCTLLGKLPDPDPLVTRLSIQPFAERFGLAALATTSRFMFAPEHRRTPEIIKLACAGAKLAREAAVRFNFGDTNPVWLEYFERLGYRRFAKAVNDRVFGYHLPIVMLMRDLAYLRSAGSPVVRYFSQREDDIEAREWFTSFAADYHYLSPVGRKLAILVANLQAQGVSPAALATVVMRHVPDGFHADLLERSNLLKLETGDVLIRFGEVDDTAFLCVAGNLVQRYRRDCRLRVLGPGDWFAFEEFLSPGPRCSSIQAVSECIVFVLPARQIRRADRRFGGALTSAFHKAGATVE